MRRAPSLYKRNFSDGSAVRLELVADERRGGAGREGVERFLDLVLAGAFTASDSGLLAYQTGPADARKQLTWFDRAGKRINTLGDPQAFFNIELSPDGRIWRPRLQMRSETSTSGCTTLRAVCLLALHPIRQANSTEPGRRTAKNIILNTTRKGHYDLFRGLTTSAGTEEALYTNDMDKVPTSWSSDGKFLLYFTGGGPRNELFVLPLTPEPARASSAATFS